jgi:hypothetical protein
MIDKSKSAPISRRRTLSFLGIGGGLSIAAGSVSALVRQHLNAGG